MIKINETKKEISSITECDEIKYDKKEILSLLKKGYHFTDEALKKAGIVKKVTIVPHICNQITEHKTDKKVYEKDTMSLKKILKTIYTIETSMTDEEIACDTNNNADDTEE